MTSALPLRRELALLLTLAGVQFTHVLDFMIMMPLGPQLTQLLSISDAQFAMLVSAYTIAAGLSGLLAATYVERFGRKRLLLVLYGCFGLATLACALVSGYSALLLARVAAGGFGGVLSALSHTIVADVIAFDRRGRAMGIVMTSFSVSTVAGVPLGLFMAQRWGWNAPFIGIAVLCAVFAALAVWSLPELDAHVDGAAASSAWQRIGSVLQDANHRRAFVFSALVMFTGFTVIPFITIYLQANVGILAAQIPLIYLCGGVATLLSSRLIGRLTDAWGKVQTFRLLAVAVIAPMLATTLLPRVPMGALLVVSTLLFVCLSGRLIPCMAILAAAANPALRGTFMTLNSAVQSAAMGSAAFVGGQVIARDAQGMVQNYWIAAVIGAIASLAAVRVVAKLDLRDAKIVSHQA